MLERLPLHQRLFAELKRRRVFHVMAMYGALAFGVIEAADVIFPRLALPDFAVTLVVWLALLGFPVVIGLAWIFDLAPDGVQRMEEADRAELREIISAPRSKRWPSGVLALLGMTALMMGTWFVGRGTAPSGSRSSRTVPMPESIAALPFLDPSREGDQEYLSDGLGGGFTPLESADRTGDTLRPSRPRTLPGRSPPRFQGPYL